MVEQGNKKVYLCNGTAGVLFVTSNDMNFSRQIAPGSKILLQESKVDELLNDQGIRNAVENGSIYLENYECEGSELETFLDDGKQPLYLTDAEIKKYLFTESGKAFEDNVLKKAGENLMERIVQIAIKENVTDGVKLNLIQKYSGKDILRLKSDLEKNK